MATTDTLDTGSEEQPVRPISGQGLLAAGGILGALAASSCCVVPLVLLSFGIGGAWMGTLTALAPYNAYIVTFTLGCLGGGFYLVYRRPKEACVEDASCAKSVSSRVVKSGLWIGTALIMVAIVIRQAGPLLFGVS